MFYANAPFAALTSAVKAALSCTAISAKILRSISTEAFLRADGYTVEGSVVDGDFVYIKNADSTINKAVVDGTESGNVFGIFKSNDPFDRIVHSGIITWGGTALQPGKPYYLSSI